MFSLESPRRGDFNENTQYTIFNVKKKKSPSIIPNLQLWDFFKGFKNKLEIAMAYEPPLFESLKFSCSLDIFSYLYIHLSSSIL